MKVVYMAREYPPRVYGGAGVHLEYLARAMARRAEVEVRCFGEQDAETANPSVLGFPEDAALFSGNDDPAREVLSALETCLRFNARPLDADVVHCHTWYSHFGGILARLAYGVPLVVTVHSLEPLRPWKRERLGRGYDLSSWVERTALERADAVIAVSERDREEILRRFEVDAERIHVIPNGVDPETFRPREGKATLTRLGIDPARPFVLFLGRISRQKGILHFLRAAELLPERVGVVLVAGSPDAPGVELELERRVEELQRRRAGVSWIRRMLPREDTVALYSEARVFCCPSIYEPFGIINLEAMACETPVVGTAVGGIRETVVHGETGLLVALTPRSADDAEPLDPEGLARELAAAMLRLIDDAELRAEMGRKGRRRVIERYGWDGIAGRVLEVYRKLAGEDEARRRRSRPATTI